MTRGVAFRDCVALTTSLKSMCAVGLGEATKSPAELITVCLSSLPRVFSSPSSLHYLHYNSRK